MSDAKNERAEPDPETLDLLFSLAKEAPEAQLRAADAVDGKMVQAFSAGGVLIGLSAIAGSRHSDAIAAFLVLAVVAFFALSALSIRGVWSRQFRVGIGAEQSWQNYWNQSPRDVKHAFAHDIAEGWQSNEDILRKKHRTLRRALVALAVEAGAIGIALIVAVV
jgi:hypothetical protein